MPISTSQEPVSAEPPGRVAVRTLPDEPARRRILFRRHSAVVRVTHWINVICLAVLLTSGLQIFNAHPALYWGSRSDFAHPALSITAEQAKDGQLRGVTNLFGARIDTTGVLGASRDGSGELRPRGFPSYLTLPPWQSLAEGRQWHFFFAWIFAVNTLVYLLYGLLGPHGR